MKPKTKKLTLKKTTVQVLKQNLSHALGGGSLRVCSNDASGCVGTFGCCQQTK